MERKTKQTLPKRRLKIDLMESGRWVDGYAPVGEGKQEEVWKETNSQKELILLERKNGNY